MQIVQLLYYKKYNNIEFQSIQRNCPTIDLATLTIAVMAPPADALLPVNVQWVATKTVSSYAKHRHN